MLKVSKEFGRTPNFAQTEPEMYRFGAFRINARTGLVWRDGAVVPIGQRGCSLLLALLRRSNDVVSKHELMEAGWPGLAVEDSNLTVQIAALRKALTDGGDGTEVIQTVPRRGYRLARTVERVTPPLVSGTAAVNRRRKLTPDRRPKLPPVHCACSSSP